MSILTNIYSAVEKSAPEWSRLERYEYCEYDESLIVRPNSFFKKMLHFLKLA